jgi:IclR family transcriptional regulator, acetate operon repressor
MLQNPNYGTTFQNGLSSKLMYLPLSRAFDMLQLFARSRGGLSVSALSEHTGLAKSAVHRLLVSLVADGYVSQEPASERYHLTLRLPALAFRFLAANGITDVVQPILDRLARQTGELIHLGLVDGDSLVWVAWAQGSQAPLRYVPVFGREVVLHATGSGATWLASLPEREALRIVRKHKFRKAKTPGYGRYAVSSEKEFLAKLRRVRRDGYSLNLEEGEPGVNAIAVAFRGGVDSNSPIVGTISIAGPSIRVSKAKLIAMLPVLRANARELSEFWPMHLQMRAMQPTGSYDAGPPTPAGVSHKTSRRKR